MLIISKKSGQLGNRLEIFARLIAYAKEYNTTVANPSFDEYAQYFEHSSTSLICKYPHKKSWLVFPLLRKLLYRINFYAAKVVADLNIRNFLFACIEIELNDRYDLIENGVPQSLFIWLHGWKFRADNLCVKHQDEIRRYFTPKDIHLKYVESIFSSVSEGYDLVVSIHIRQGDYEQFKDGKYYYTSEEYRSFIKQISSLFKKKSIRFLICSNIVQKDSVFEGYNVSFGSGHLIEDLYLLSRCMYLFGPPSTYTKWTSFYGNVPLGVIEDRHQKLQLSQCEVAQL